MSGLGLHVVSIRCECGAEVRLPTALRPDQTLLGNAALADTLLMYAMPSVDAACSCPKAGEP